MARPDDRDEGFLARWSRRKAEESEQSEAPKEAPVPTDETAVQAPQASSPEPEPEPLPDPDSLGRDADWSRFLRADVPPALRSRALRRLWRLDPVYANLDGLVDYAEDYNDPALFGGPVKTLYQVGRGIFAPPDPESEAGVPEGAEAAAANEAGETEAAETETAETEAAEPTPQAAADPAGPSAGPSAETAAEAGDAESDSPAPPRRGRGALARRWGPGPASEEG